jgi:cyclopropane fatty-acyl-phospholipid synthase-like methyltransferase
MVVDSTEYKRRTTKAYNALSTELAGGYDHYFETYARLEADHFLSRLHKGDAILDLGCGVGTASRYFAEQGYTPVGADLSEEMVKECKRRGLASPVRLDLETLPFLYSSFDGVWAHTSLLHIPKQRLPSAIEGLEKILKLGGALFIALREGAREGYEGQLGVERWFAYFQADEFESHIPSTYRIVRCSRTEGQSVTFLNYHLVKEDER